MSEITLGDIREALGLERDPPEAQLINAIQIQMNDGVDPKLIAKDILARLRGFSTR